MFISEPGLVNGVGEIVSCYECDGDWIVESTVTGSLRTNRIFVGGFEEARNIFVTLVEALRSLNKKRG